MHGSKNSTRTSRETLDFYPTPTPVTRVLAQWLAARLLPDPNAVFLDPAAGDGALILEGQRVLPGKWLGIELDPARAAVLKVQTGDALVLPWPVAHVIVNPPFRHLDDFWVRAVTHRADHAVWVAMFMPVAWWSAERRKKYVRPDHILQLGWRPTFRPQAGPAHKGSQDFAWSVLAPNQREYTTWERVERPEENVWYGHAPARNTH